MGSLADPQAQNALRHLQARRMLGLWSACYGLRPEKWTACSCRCAGVPLASCAHSVHVSFSWLQEIAPFLRVLGSYPMDTEL